MEHYQDKHLPEGKEQVLKSRKFPTVRDDTSMFLESAGDLRMTMN